MTATRDVLRAISQDDRPRQAILTIGHTGWGPGQLESEIQTNSWLSVAADTDLVFDSDNDSKWERALAKLGVSPELFSGDIGHA